MSVKPFGLSFPGKREVLASLQGRPTSVLRVDHERSIGFSRAEHAFVEGDNLQSLQLLLPAYFGQVQAIYLDPPYNTGRDFVYRDRFAETVEHHLRRTGQVDEAGQRLVANPEHGGRYHSAWLSMMYPRLYHLRQLLRDDGVLFCSIDDHEVHHLRMLLDEIFGEDCFIAQIVVVANRGGRDYLRIATGHEYLLCYGATPDAPIRELPKTGREPRHVDARGAYELRELRNRNPKFHPGNRPNLSYPFWIHPQLHTDRGEHAVSLQPRAGYEVQTLPRNSAGEGSVWRWGQAKAEAGIVLDDPEASDVVARRRRDGQFNVYEKHRKRTTKPRALWDEPELRSERGSIVLRELLGKAVFDHPKPVELVTRCLQLATDPDGLVLDPFAGSGTTGQAVVELNAADGGRRRALLLQLPEPTPEHSPAREAGYETVGDIGLARMRQVLQGRTDAGLRVFATEPRDARQAHPTGDLQALQHREPARANEAHPWARALAAGLPLHARERRQAGFRIWEDPDRSRTFAWTHRRDLTVQDVVQLELQPGSVLVIPDDALSDADRLRLARTLQVQSW